MTKLKHEWLKVSLHAPLPRPEFHPYAGRAISFNTSKNNLIITEILLTPVARSNLFSLIHFHPKQIQKHLSHRMIFWTTSSSVPQRKIGRIILQLKLVFRHQCAPIPVVPDSWESDETMFQEIMEDLRYGICVSNLENEATMIEAELQRVYLTIDPRRT